METSKLLDADFKTLVISMLIELSENFNSIKQVMQTIKNNQSEMKNTLIKIKNNLPGINSKMDEAKNQVNDLEHTEEKDLRSVQQEEKRIQKNKDQG